MRVRSFYLLIFLHLLAPNAFCQALETTSYQDIDALRARVREFLQGQYQSVGHNDDGTVADNVTVAVARLDPRLRLRQCDNPLTFELMDNGKVGGNISVRTRCEGSHPWSIFVQAQVNFSVSVLVAKHNLSRGTVLQPTDLEQLSLNSQSMTADYIVDPERAVGMELTRPLQKGRAVRLAMLLEPKVIKRGDAVVIEAQSGQIFVATPGTALSDGKVGQQIRVRNERSQREVKVEVVGPGRVRVLI